MKKGRSWNFLCRQHKTMFIASESLLNMCCLCSWNLSAAKSAEWKKNSDGLPSSWKRNGLSTNSSPAPWPKSASGQVPGLWRRVIGWLNWAANWTRYSHIEPNSDNWLYLLLLLQMLMEWFVTWLTVESHYTDAIGFPSRPMVMLWPCSRPNLTSQSISIFRLRNRVSTSFELLI